MIRRAVAATLLLAGSLWSPDVQAARAAAYKVRFVSAKRTYVDAGLVEGLRAGASVRITRKGRVVVTCAVDQVGDHQASCPSARARVGDVVQFDAAAPQKGAAPVTLPPLPSSTEIGAAQQSLASATAELVDFHGGSSARSLTQGLPFVTLTLGHDAYVGFGDSQYQQERIDLSVNGVSIRWAGFRAFAHMTALIATVRPALQRFRPNDLVQFYVWETALTSREAGRPFTLSVGRVAPYHTPGLSLLDGAQVGWRPKSGQAEVGAYGGTIPDLITMYPTGDHWTGGAYYAHSLIGGPKSKLRLLRTEGRLGLRGAPGIGPQLELEWLIQAALAGKVDLGAQARATTGAGDWAHPRVESASAHIGLRPIEPLRLVATVRYLGPRPVDFDSFTSRFFVSSDRFFTTSHMVHGTFDLNWDIRSWVTLMLQAGADYDRETGNGRQYFGPELTFPRLFGRVGGLGVGYREELGWYAGREGHLQFTSSAIDRVRAILRASYLEDRIGGGFTSLAQRELGLSAMVEVRVIRWFSVRGTALSRVAIDGTPGSNPGGLTAHIDLIGSL